MPDFLYKLTALFLGLSIADEAGSREIEYNGFRFSFYTFADEKLRQLQLWMIESELEQAIGRVRLLRHNCTVYLYSNFPVNQTTLSEEV